MKHCNTKHSGSGRGGQSWLQVRGRLRDGSELLSRNLDHLIRSGEHFFSHLCKLFNLEVQKREKVKEMLLVGPSCGEKDWKAGEIIYRN